MGRVIWPWTSYLSTPGRRVLGIADRFAAGFVADLVAVSSRQRLLAAASPSSASG